MPPKSSSHHNHDLSHIPSSLVSQSEVVPTELENMHIPVPTGEVSSHNTVISHIPHPLEEHRGFWTVGEIVRHEEGPNVSVQETRREVREILVGMAVIPIDGGPPRFDKVPSRRSSRIITPQPRNLAEVHPMPIRNIEVVP